MVPMPKKSKENFNILIIRLIDFDANNLNFQDALTVFSMVYDVSIVTPDHDSLADGEIVIYDLNGINAKHVAKFRLSLLRCFFGYVMDAHPLKIKQIHVLNTSSLIDRMMILFKPFLGSKAMKIVHFHAPNSQTLFNFFPHDVLPNELGGSAGSIEVPKWNSIHRIEELR